MKELNYNDVAKSFTLKALDWNRNVFGNIFWRKKRLLAKLGGIQRALKDYYSHGLIDLEKQLRVELEEVLILLFTLQNPVEDVEIKTSVFGMHPLKAPSPDGFHAILYHTQWAMMYRPIFLFNVAYKTITKVIANRLQTILPQLVGPHQTSFVPGRHITENIMIAQERLSHGILNVVSAGKWHPITLSRNDVPLSHTFFADDLLLFAEASVEQASVISSVLDSFCYSFSSKVNKSKTLIYFSKNVGDSEANVISGMLGYSVTKDLGKYLGIPLQYSRVSSCMYQGLIAKVERRLSSWTASHLSLAGRITLAQSVLQAISIYKISMVSWRNVCKPKSIGGLGFKSLSMMNKALHMKLAWGFISSPESLWVKVLRTKYGVAIDTPPETLHTRYGSHLWKSIGTVWSKVLASRWWCLGNGDSVFFLWDLWVTKDLPLAAYAMDIIPVHILDCKVSTFIKDYGSWWWDRFEYLLLNNIILQIAAVHPPSPMHGLDACFLAHSRAGLFTIELTYLILSGSILVVDDYRWRRHIPILEACDRCGALIEDTLHVLRDCVVVKTFWLKVVLLEKRQSFFSSNLSTWLCGNVDDCTLNTDGAHKANGVSTAGGLIRDYLGRWITGFGLMLGSCSITMAELRGTYKGILSLLGILAFGSCMWKLTACVQLRCWLDREANSATDFMVNLACSLPLGLMVYPSPPLGVTSLLLYDSYGVATHRSVVL
ncbi:putative ribonuclease H protein [Citrus sinensis]|nr:putative ribonuclease H protein [Citrus sinensis]